MLKLLSLTFAIGLVGMTYSTTTVPTVFTSTVAGAYQIPDGQVQFPGPFGPDPPAPSTQSNTQVLPAATFSTMTIRSKTRSTTQSKPQAPPPVTSSASTTKSAPDARCSLDSFVNMDVIPDYTIFWCTCGSDRMDPETRSGGGTTVYGCSGTPLTTLIGAQPLEQPLTTAKPCTRPDLRATTSVCPSATVEHGSISTDAVFNAGVAFTGKYVVLDNVTQAIGAPEKFAFEAWWASSKHAIIDRATAEGLHESNVFHLKVESDGTCCPASGSYDLYNPDPNELRMTANNVFETIVLICKFSL
ncbi:hypothetical protein MMC21_006825 [Puttea exsequens]|nr:hypothetical protein [Puttea exsequens]